MIAAVVLEAAGIIMMLFRRSVISKYGIFAFYIGGTGAALGALLSIGLALLGLMSSWKSLFMSVGIGMLGSLLFIALFNFSDRVSANVPAAAEHKRKPKKELKDPSPWTLPVIMVMAAALAVKALSNFLNLFFGWAVTIPVEWFDFITAVLLIIFLIICALTMTPLGLLGFTIIACLGCISVYLLVFGLAVMVTGFVFAGILSALLSGVLITGFAIGGTFFITSITVVTYVPVLIPAIAMMPMTAAAAGGAGLLFTAGMTGTQSNSGSTFMKKLLNTLINFALVFTICIPLLTAFTGMAGIFRSKPGEIFGLQFLNRHNLITADTSLDKEPGLGSGKLREFYANMDVFEKDNLNPYQITDEFNLDADVATISILHGGVLHVYDAGTMKVLTQEACPIKNDRNTVILSNSIETYVLGDEELFIVNYDSASRVRHCFRKEYPWRNEFLAMSEEEQMDHIYHLLMDSESLFSAPLEQAALVKLSAQHGQLVHYDLEEKYAVFAKRNDNGTVTFLVQTSPEERNEIATVGYCDDIGRVPWFWDNVSRSVNVLSNPTQLSGVFMDGSVYGPNDMHAGRELLSWNTIHNYNYDYCIASMTPDRLYVFNYVTEQWVHMDTEPEITENSTGILQVGDSMYIFWYPEDNSLLRKYTYLKDMQEMTEWPFKKKYIESHYHGLQYIYRTLDESFGSGN